MIFIAGATINRYGPIPKSQLITVFPLELIVSGNPPPSRAADIVDTMSVICCGICCPPNLEPVNFMI